MQRKTLIHSEFISLVRILQTAGCVHCLLQWTPWVQHEFQIDTNKIASKFLSSDHTNFWWFHIAVFAEDGLETYTVLKRMPWAIVLPIKSFVLPCPSCHCNPCLLKVPINLHMTVVLHAHTLQPPVTHPSYTPLKDEGIHKGRY